MNGSAHRAVTGWGRRALLLATPIVLLWGTVLSLKLTPAFFAGVLTFGASQAMTQRFARSPAFARHARLYSAAVVAVVTLLLIVGLVEFVLWAPQAIPKLFKQLATTLEQLRGLLPAWASYLPDSVDTVRREVIVWLKANAAAVQSWGLHTARGIGYVILGLVIGGLAAVQVAWASSDAPNPKPLPPLAQAIFDYTRELVASFTQVVFAQVKISLVNTALTAVFLVGILPLLGRTLPLTPVLLVVTFVAGLLPVVGNLISNTITTLVALSVSVIDAVLALGWLVFIHKLEYFLNAHIIGNRIRSHAWEILTMMVVLEAAFGVAGVVSAPVFFAQLKSTLRREGLL
ncbi:MAG: hypothetical protein WHS85_06520 [Hydrogenophilus sp.]|uniref:AI-2E family transporter n=1 Tax=Hydrogenophilus thermoluteolus TaxID=297 RepID=UPI0024A20864|nr:hypothetical protein [Hydrogenophilus thermoluteolus]GLW60202.1 membrane protein [Hydrogenophilus thermoluteolus]